MAQLRSIRPEADVDPYVEWFSSTTNSTARLFVTAADNAFSFLWSAVFFAWIFPPAELVQLAVEKFFRDQSRGAVVVLRDTRSVWYRALTNRAAVIVDIRSHGANTVPCSSLGDLTVFIIDQSDPRAAPVHLVLTVPIGCGELFRAPRCPFVHDFWKSACRITLTAPS